jgi:hypothetical protein
MRKTKKFYKRFVSLDNPRPLGKDYAEQRLLKRIENINPDDSGFYGKH